MASVSTIVMERYVKQRDGRENGNFTTNCNVIVAMFQEFINGVIAFVIINTVTESK